MSRGPGRMMRAALAELDERSTTSAYNVAQRSAHDTACGCVDDQHCIEKFTPTRAQLVSARRALHSLAERGDVMLGRQADGWRPVPPCLIAKCCEPRRVAPVGNVYEMVGLRETDRCDSCARPFSEDVRHSGTCYGLGEDLPRFTVRVKGLALCYECNNGLMDPVGLLSSEHAIDRMTPIPCGDCGGELSRVGLERIYVKGATLPLCDSCYRGHTDARLAELGITVGGEPWPPHT